MEFDLAENFPKEKTSCTLGHYENPTDCTASAVHSRIEVVFVMAILRWSITSKPFFQLHPFLLLLMATVLVT